LPKLQEEVKLELKEKGMNPELIKLVLQERKMQEFEALLKLINKPDLIAKVLILWPKEIASHEKISQNEVDKKLTLDVIESLLSKLVQSQIKEAQLKQIMEEIVKGKTIEQSMKTESINLKDVEHYIQTIVKEKTDLSVNAYMGLAIQKYKGKVSPKDISDILKKYVKQ
jgi:Glu-tRNA(Gln) amidotransferase subunit E-like FAD-binding protein